MKKYKKMENSLKNGKIPKEIFLYIDIKKTDSFKKEMKEYKKNINIRKEKTNLSNKYIENKISEWEEKRILSLGNNIDFLLKEIRELVIVELYNSSTNGTKCKKKHWYFPKCHFEAGGGFRQQGILILEFEGEMYNISEVSQYYNSFLDAACYELLEKNGWINRKFDNYKVLRKFYKEEEFEDFNLVEGHSDEYIDLINKKIGKKRLY